MWVLWMLFWTSNAMAVDKLYFQTKADCETARAQVNLLHVQPVPGKGRAAEYEMETPGRMTLCLPAGFIVPRATPR